MRVAAFDLSSKTGHAFWKPGMERPILGTKQLVGWQYDLGSMLEFWRKWLQGYFEAYDPELVALEGWMLPQHGDAETIKRQVALLAFTHWCCKASGRKSVDVYAASWRKSFLGSGRGSTDEFKRKAVAACAAMGWPAADHNAAEAAGVLHHTCDQVAKVQVPWRDPHLFYIQTQKPVR